MSSDELIQAVLDRNIIKVEALLKDKNIDINANDSRFDANPLDVATFQGFNEIVTKLLAMPNIDVNVVNPYGYTPLMGAIEKGHSEVVEKLLEMPEIDLNFKNNGSLTALHWAVYQNKNDIVKKLLAHQSGTIDVNSKDWTPLHIASYFGYSKIVDQLLTISNIDINIKNDLGQTALDLAIQRGHNEIVEKLNVYNSYKL